MEGTRADLANSLEAAQLLQQTVDALRVDLSAANDQIHVLKMEQLPEIQKKLTTAEDMLRWIELLVFIFCLLNRSTRSSAANVELESAQHELRVNHDVIISTRDALVKAEASLQTMQTEFLVIRTNEQADTLS